MARESRYRARMIPWATLVALPPGATSTSLAVKSVSGADDAAHRTTLTGPTTSRSAGSGGLV